MRLACLRSQGDDWIVTRSSACEVEADHALGVPLISLQDKLNVRDFRRDLDDRGAWSDRRIAADETDERHEGEESEEGPVPSGAPMILNPHGIQD